MGADAHATLLTTLRLLVPRVVLRAPTDTPKLRDFELGAMLGMRFREGAFFVTVAEGMELRFQIDLDAWRKLGAAIQSGELSFDDPERGCWRIAEILGTHREHLDA